MIQHDMMIKLIDMPKEQKEENCKKIKALVEGLKKDIPEIISVHVGLNISPRPITFDLIASSKYKNQEDLEKFRAHPAHLKVVEFVKTVEKQGVLVDHII